MSDKSLKQVTTKHASNFTVVFLLAAPLVLIFYGLYMFNPVHAANPVAYALHVGADAIGMFVILSLWLTILLDLIVPHHHRKELVSTTAQKFLKDKKPTIDIFVTTAGEDIETIERTAKAAMQMDYPHTTYLLDDGKSDDVQRLAKRLGAKYITRPTNDHAKAGNVNNGLLHSSAEFFAIFDADHIPEKNFITTLLPYMANEDIAMVQSPQYYSNTDNFIAKGAAEGQDVFYKFVQPAKNVSDSAFCVGTNMIFRRTAIDEIGGIAKINHSEDIWTSFQLHNRGWSTLFVNEVLAKGQAPDTIVSYLKQQTRWAKGGFSMLFDHNPLSASNLSFDQKIQYFSSNIFFFVGFSVLIYLILPLLYMLFGIKSVETNPVWLVHYLPYIMLYYGLSIILIGKKISIATIAVATATFYAHILAFFQILFGGRSSWNVTGARKKAADPVMKWIWPHITLIILSVCALIVGWYSANEFNILATAANTIWILINIFLLVRFVFYQMKFSLEFAKEVKIDQNESYEIQKIIS